MNSEELRKAQLIQLDILKEFRRICENNGLAYWLDSGTLLGAVRHGGFIPWDDDLDVGMPRKDYERFKKIVKRQLDSKYVFQDWYTTKGYGFPFGKIRKKNTLWRELQVPELGENGLYIDIFPYDVMPIQKHNQLIQHYCVDILKRAIGVHYGDKSWRDSRGINWKRFLRYIPVFVIAIFVNDNTKLLYDRIQSKFNGSDLFECYYPSGTAVYGKYVIPKGYLDKLDSVMFEGEEFSCPSKKEKFLSIVYGDFMKLPPEEKRSIGHSIVEFSFTRSRIN